MTRTNPATKSDGSPAFTPRCRRFSRLRISAPAVTSTRDSIGAEVSKRPFAHSPRMLAAKPPQRGQRSRPASSTFLLNYPQDRCASGSTAPPAVSNPARQAASTPKTRASRFEQQFQLLPQVCSASGFTPSASTPPCRHTAELPHLQRQPDVPSLPDSPSLNDC